MKKRAERAEREQGPRPPIHADAAELRQLLFPMVAGIAATRTELMGWVHAVGLSALEELLRDDAARIAGPKGVHRAERTHHHWGSVPTELPLGGRRVTIKRPRVRSRSGREEVLPTLAHLRGTDPLPERVVNQILVGVSTRGYDASLEAPPAGVRSRGTSRSAASRHLVARTSRGLRDQLVRRLDDVRLAVLMLDGLNVGEHTVVVALGVTPKGVKIPLGLWVGSTENARVCTDLLQNILERGLKVDDPILCAIDGGKGIRKALRDVWGDLAVVQRCQVHKLRNVRDQLPDHRHMHVTRVMRDAYGSASTDVARRRLRALAAWLERNGEATAAGSLREGLEETLTVMKLGLPSSLRRSLSTTNSVENLISSIRKVTRNVKRWRGADMARRWTALGIHHAERNFRRFRGFEALPVLVAALKNLQPTVDADQEAA
jgi:putative transposase